MSSDFRYHIASLAGIFLALGIGILIGTAFVGAPVVSRQTQLIQHLESGVSDLRRETEERQQTEQALRALLPGIVAGKLAEKRVLVVQTGTYADAADEAADALRLAGATVERVALPSDAWSRVSQETTIPTARREIEDQARRLAPLLVGGANDGLQNFRDGGLLTGDSPLAGTARYVVLVGGTSTPPAMAPGTDVQATDDNSPSARLSRTRDSVLASAWVAAGVTVVGVEPFEADISFMRPYQNAGISTIDSIDRAAGKIALPFVLLGEKGNYGLKSTADRSLPASLEQAPSSPAPSSPAPSSPAPSSPAPSSPAPSASPSSASPSSASPSSARP